MRRLLIAFTILVAAAGRAQAQPALSGSCSPVQSGTSPLTISSFNASGTNTFLVVFVTVNSATVTISSVVFNTTETLSLITGTNTRGNTNQLVSWYGVTPSASTANIVVTLSANANAQVTACLFTGVNQSTPTSGGVSSGFSFSDASENVTSATGDLVVDGIYYNSGSNPAVGAGQTVIENTAANFYGWGASTEPGAASVTMSWTTNASTSTHAAFNLKAVGGGGGSTPCRLPLLGVGKCGD
jgi:hypothetical protein